VKMNIEERNVGKILLLALAGTPAIVFVGLIVITLIGAIDQEITKVQESGQWWVILIFAYVISLIYFLFKPTKRIDNEKKKELAAEMRNKLQSLKTTIEQLEKEKDIPRAIVETSMGDLNSLEELVDGIDEGLKN